MDGERLMLHSDRGFDSAAEHPGVRDRSDRCPQAGFEPLGHRRSGWAICERITALGPMSGETAGREG